MKTIQLSYEQHFDVKTGLVIKEMWEIGNSSFYLKLGPGLLPHYGKVDRRKNQAVAQFELIWNRRTNESRRPTYQISQKYYLVQFVHRLRQMEVFDKKIPTGPSVSDYNSITMQVYLVSCFNQNEFLLHKIQTPQITDCRRKCNPIFAQDKIINCQLDKQDLIVNQICKEGVEYDKRMLMTFLALEILSEFDENLLSMIADLTTAMTI